MVVQFVKALFFKMFNFFLPLSKFLNIGSDGPIVNKTIWNYLNEEKVRMGITGLMQFIP